MLCICQAERAFQGSWGGTGAKKLPPKPNLIKKIAGVDPSSRADYKKKHVIISERRDKKAAKYLVNELPFPYTSHAQYARSMDVPIGVEWNTRVGFQRGTLPRVVKKVSRLVSIVIRISRSCPVLITDGHYHRTPRKTALAVRRR